MRFGQRLWVCPAGMQPEGGDDPVIIDLDPGLAFGTGTHPTTALCLEWLDRHPPRDAAVLDYGCGSGILAIAALKLGAREVWAVDIDEQALWASRENAARNRVDARLKTALPAALPERDFDLLLANILANPLIELAPRLAERVRPGGDLVLSGILAAQAGAVREAYRSRFLLSETVEQDGWVRVQGTRKDVP
jgi:ribosomal protein L11 methyltransferase